MYAKDFYKRLYDLRNKKGISARDMSLSIGQNAGYINNIENGNNLPSMRMFFYICDYLEITPMEFFDYNAKNPSKIDNVVQDIKQLNDEQLDNIDFLIKELIKKR